MKYIIPLLSVTALLFLLSTCAKKNVFREPPDHPVIDSLAPASGALGTQIRLWGSGFSTRPSLNTVRINGVLVRVDSPSTSRVLLVTVTDSTGTGPVNVKLNGRSAEGPVFTYLGNGNARAVPVITAVEFGWNDGQGYAVYVKTLPAADSSVRLLVGGVSIPIIEITREGSLHYDPAKGYRLLVSADASVRANANGIYANFVVAFNGVPSAPSHFQLIPGISLITSRHGDYVFAAGDTITITGNFFGDPTLPSLLDIRYNGQPLSPAPRILSWKNTEIKASMPAYNVQTDASIPIAVKVGEKGSGVYACKYVGVLTATVGLIAGSGPGNTNAIGAAAAFNNPAGIALDASGNLYVADQGNNCIRQITHITNFSGYVSTLAGSRAGFYDGVAANALFNKPTGVAVDANGTVYVADFANNRIRAISGGSVITHAGNGSSSVFYYPTGIAMNSNNVAYVADMNNHRIQGIINAAVFTLAGGVAGYADGSGTAAKFNLPYGVAVGPDGTVYVADGQNHAIRTINANGVVRTLAGGSSGKADGTGAAAQFELPRAVAVDAQGNVYVADFYNPHIRKISPQGVVTTLSGVFADGSGIAWFSAPAGIAVDPQGNIYVSDAGTHRIYKMIF